MILYAVMAQSSVVQLFVAGIIPGILGGFNDVCSLYLCKKKDLPVEEAFDFKILKKQQKKLD